MMNADYFWAFLTTAGSAVNEALCDRLGAHPMVEILTVLEDGNLQCWGHYRGSEGLDDLIHILHDDPEVVDVEFHTLLAAQGRKCSLKPAHVRVLHCLRNDVRMQVKEIAHQTGFSPRRVRRLLDELLVRGGSGNAFFAHETGVGDAQAGDACFYASIDSDVAATGFTRFLVRIEYRGGDAARWNLVKWLLHRFAPEIYYIMVSASDTVIFALFLLEYMSQTPEVLQQLNTAPGVISMKQFIHYSHRFYPGLQEAFWMQLETTD
jgi:hypothetical protein